MEKKLTALSISIGFIYLLFGGLKFFPNLSPAEAIGCDTVMTISGGIIPDFVCIKLLALLEVVIGLMMMSKRTLRYGIWLALFHMVMTFTPFLLFPDLTFGAADSLAPSLLGQYIIKNIVIICALLVIYPTRHRDNRSQYELS